MAALWPIWRPFYGGHRTVGEVLRRMRCSGACAGRVGAAWLVTGPVLNARVRPRRVPLLGPGGEGVTPDMIAPTSGDELQPSYSPKSRLPAVRLRWAASLDTRTTIRPRGVSTATP